MPASTCAHTKPNGHPCAARPLPGSTLCLFHDPAYAQAQAEARSKGGATPRRRTRRFPRLLDHYHIAELLGELFVDALNHADPTNPRCLNAITSMARVLLTAVGTPDDQYREEQDRSEPAPSEDHLLRLYPGPAGVEAAPLPPAGQPLHVTPTTDPSDPSDPSDPTGPSQPNTQHPTPNTQPLNP